MRIAIVEAGSDYALHTADIEAELTGDTTQELVEQAKAAAAARGVSGAFDGQTEIELLLFEVSRMARRDVSVSIVDDQGRFHDRSQVDTTEEFICLNRKNPTCIPADPPVNMARDDQIKRDGKPVKRFGCVFAIDENRRLLVDVIDRLTGREIYKKHPVVRL